MNSLRLPFLSNELMSEEGSEMKVRVKLPRSQSLDGSYCPVVTQGPVKGGVTSPIAGVSQML